MKRYIFFLLLLGAICTSTYFVFCGDAGLDAGIKAIGDLIESVIDLSLFKLGFNAAAILIYGLLLFLLINAVLLLSLLFMIILHGGRLSIVRKFYSGATWFFIGALLFTFTFIYSIYDLSGSFDITLEALANLPWYQYLPIASSFVLLILSIIFRKTESEY